MGFFSSIKDFVGDTIGVAGDLAGAFIGADASSDAADAIADSNREAAAVYAEYADGARESIMTQYSQAYTNLYDAMLSSRGALVAGQDTAADIITSAAPNLSNIINDTSNAAMSLITGTNVGTGGMTADPNTGLFRNNQTGQIQQSGRFLRPGEDPAYIAREEITPLVTGDAVTDQIHEEYATQLGRVPNEEEVAYWRDAANSNPTIAQNLSSVIAQAASEQPLSGDALTNQIHAEYATQLGRVPNEEELTYWTNAALNNPEVATNLGATIANASQEWTQLQGAVDGIGLQASLAELGSTPTVTASRVGNVPDAVAAQYNVDDALAMAARGGQQAVGQLEQYGQTGESALGQQAAMSGALGNEAQQAYYDNFMESPGQKYFREKQEESLLRNQSATGGLGGGNILTALQEQAYGIAAQYDQQQFANLGSLSTMGLNARSTQGSLIQQNALARAGISADAASGNAALQNTANMQTSQNQMSAASQNASLAQQASLQNAANQGTYDLARSQLRAGAAADLSQIALGAGSAQLGLESGNATTLAELARRTGISEAVLMESFGNNLVGIKTGAATALSNLATQSGTAQANLISSSGDALAAGELGTANAWSSGLQNIASGIGNYIGGLPTSTPVVPTVTPTITNNYDTSQPYTPTGVDPWGR